MQSAGGHGEDEERNLRSIQITINDKLPGRERKILESPLQQRKYTDRAQDRSKIRTTKARRKSQKFHRLRGNCNCCCYTSYPSSIADPKGIEPPKYSNNTSNSPSLNGKSNQGIRSSITGQDIRYKSTSEDPTIP